MSSPLQALTLAYALRYSPAVLNRLVEQAGSIDTVMQHHADIRQVLPDASERLQRTLAHLDEARQRAEQELAFCEQKQIQVLVRSSDSTYPARLMQCDDAPHVLYYRGTAALNATHTLSIVGTRHVTTYGRDFVKQLIDDLAQRLPQLLVVSGLAYGVDICAHRQALSQGMNTVGVLAHGLDTIYPAAHRQDANRMAVQGGLLSEYMSGTKAEKMQFVQRNRIVAGMTDATLVVESADKGGALITARIAREYNRDVMALPGRYNDNYSQGCNRLIRDNIAALVTSADDVTAILGWQKDVQQWQQRGKGVEQQLFPTLSEEEKRIVELLQKENDLNVNILSVQTGIDVGQLFALLFNLEMQGIVKPYAGGTYHLVQ